MGNKFIIFWATGSIRVARTGPQLIRRSVQVGISGAGILSDIIKGNIGRAYSAPKVGIVTAGIGIPDLALGIGAESVAIKGATIWPCTPRQNRRLAR